jgi:hypothetical protein
VTRLPSSCVVRQRVEAAIAAGVDGDEKPEVERWLEGQRRLSPSLLSFPDCDGIEIRVRQPLADANQRLMDFLGVSVIVDENAPPNVSFGDVTSNKQLRLKEVAW